MAKTLMSYLELLKDLDHKPNQERFEIIKRRLRNMNVRFSEQRYSSGTNLIVDLGSGHRRIGIASHFDRVVGAGGANDNGSAVAVCLDIIEKFVSDRRDDIDLRLFFFDEEETGLKGSTAYVDEHGIADLTGLINMELVGLGDGFALWPVSTEAHGRLLEIFESTCKGKSIRSNRFDRIVTNTADHVPFREAGLADSFTVTCISLRDITIAAGYYAALDLGVKEEKLFSILSKAPVFQHYHMPTDTFEKVDDSTIAMTSSVIWETILRNSLSCKQRGTHAF
jgi:Zn-dependent M28 family amino/carboxypeptidase